MMQSKPRAAILIATVFSSYLKGQKGRRQSLFCTQTNLLGSWASHCLPANDNFCGVQLGPTTFPNHLPQQGYGAVGKPCVEGRRGLSTAVEATYLVGGRMALCLFNARNIIIRNGSTGMAVVPAVPGSISKGRPCQYDGCKVKQSNYGFRGAPPTRCRKHMLKGMLIWSGGCQEQGCNKKASCNFPGRAGIVRCEAHKLEGMVNNYKPVCRSSGCTSSATHGYAKEGKETEREGERGPLYCKSHATNDMTAIHHSHVGRCQWKPGCVARARYGDVGDMAKRFCGKHREPDMVYLHGRCENAGCIKFALYGWPGMGVWLRCSDHKEAAMVARTVCKFPGCVLQASFGFEGGKTASRCAAHKEDGMQMLKKRVCTAHGCGTQASFAKEGEKNPSRCAAHKEEGMINVWKNVCSAQGCTKQPNFGKEGEKRASRCAAHKEEGMMNMMKNVCTAPGCMTIASFGKAGETRRLRCAKHKEDGMQYLHRQPPKRHPIPHAMV